MINFNLIYFLLYLRNKIILKQIEKYQKAKTDLKIRIKSKYSCYNNDY